MTPLPAPREDVLAHALAMGRSRSEASCEAGYARHGNYRERAARRQIAARAAELTEARKWGETCKVTAMIPALMRLAGKAGGMSTAAAMTAARGLVAEAARLEQKSADQRETAHDAAADAQNYLPLSDEAWAATYGRRG